MPVVIGPSMPQHLGTGTRRNITDPVLTWLGMVPRKVSVVGDGALKLLLRMQLLELRTIRFSIPCARLMLTIGSVKAFGLLELAVLDSARIVLFVL